MGSIPITRSTSKINHLANKYEKNERISALFATKPRSAVTRRDPPLRFGGFFGLWQVCGKQLSPLRRTSAALPYPNVYPSATLPLMKDVGLRIRLQRDLREQFLAACQAEDKPAAQVLRDFMRAYVRERTGAAATVKPEEVLRGPCGDQEI